MARPDSKDPLVDVTGDLTVAAILSLADEAAQGSAVDVPHAWKHSGGIFGGFTASLALATAAKVTGFDAIAGVQVLFARPTEPGPLEIAVEVLHRGRSSAAVHVRARQGGVDRVVAQSWLVTGPIDVGERNPMAVAAPDACPEVTCWDESLPFIRAIDERAIDYPLSIEGFPGGPPSADLWIRAVGIDASVNPLAGQLLEVVALDTHMVDAAIRPQPSMDLSSVLSLDLNVWWSCTTPTEWRRVRVDAPGQGNRLTPIVGAVWSPDGTVRARASQLARFSPKRP